MPSDSPMSVSADPPHDPETCGCESHSDYCPQNPASIYYMGSVSADRPERKGHPEYLCERCRLRNAWSWHAPSPLWNAVMRDRETGQDKYSVVCPSCFAELAAGVIGSAVWCFKPHGVDVRPLWTDGDGRVWSETKCLWVAADRPVENSELPPLMAEMAKQASLGHKLFCVRYHQHEDGQVEEEWIEWSEAFRRISEGTSND